MDIAVITGASSGLGKVFAEKVCTRYPDLDEVWLIARRKDRLEQFAQEHDQCIGPVIYRFDLVNGLKQR